MTRDNDHSLSMWSHLAKERLYTEGQWFYTRMWYKNGFNTLQFDDDNEDD